MAARVYLRPFVSEAPGGVALAGGLVAADRFAVLVRDEGPARLHALTDAGGVPGALASLPVELREDAARQWVDLRSARTPLVHGSKSIALDRPKVMGILNATPDSFSDGGRLAADPARGAAMVADGAAIVDVGGESTRPGHAAVDEAEEIARVVPAIARLAGSGVAISVDTRRAEVMRAALAAGAHILNDVSAFRDPRAAEVATDSGAPVVLMEAPGEGEDLHARDTYRDVALDVFDFLRARRDAAVAAGIARGQIVLDPGIGFGKSTAEDVALMNALPLFHALGQPLLIGASRKKTIPALAGDAPTGRRIGGSLALALKALDAGVQIVRVHDVFETVQALRLWQGLREASGDVVDP